MANFTAIYDACVFYPAPLRGLLLRIARIDLFRAKWAKTINEEWLKGSLINRPDLDEGKLKRIELQIYILSSFSR